MCGITGVFNYKNTSPVDRDVLLGMRDVMVHRGPDGGGDWMSQDGRIAFGHRRLSIIDLSETANQPMHDGTGLTVTFNGEIYNHTRLRQELRQAGIQFKTDHSDTEVLLHGFRHWGFDGLLQRIEGDFAFAIWDEKKRKLSLARDRIGVKPLYFGRRRGVRVRLRDQVAAGISRRRPGDRSDGAISLSELPDLARTADHVRRNLEATGRSLA